MKENKWFVLALIVALALGTLGLAGCSDTSGDGESTSEETSAEEELAGSINVEGSDTLVNMAQEWAEVFMEENPGVMISVKGGGSGTGIAALINGTVDFADASRAIKDEEVEEAEANGVDPVEHEVAIDGIAVIVNPGNTATELTHGRSLARSTVARSPTGARSAVRTRTSSCSAATPPPARTSTSRRRSSGGRRRESPSTRRR